LTPQKLVQLQFIDHAMTNLPSVTDLTTIGSISFRGCPKIDETGKVIGKWPDQVWHGK
jgi:hypothetical protein